MTGCVSWSLPPSFARNKRISFQKLFQKSLVEVLEVKPREVHSPPPRLWPPDVAQPHVNSHSASCNSSNWYLRVTSSSWLWDVSPREAGLGCISIDEPTSRDSILVTCPETSALLLVQEKVIDFQAVGHFLVVRMEVTTFNHFTHQNI